MSKANNSKNWIKNHVKDPFVIQAQKDGYRSRAAYKLIEIDKKYRIIKLIGKGSSGYIFQAEHVKTG